MLYITEDDINQWASFQHNADDILPDLMRRIIYAVVPGVNQEFSAYRATNLGGYDGKVVTQEPTIFSDTTSSVWELSVRADCTTKANDDYQKRTENPEGVDKSITTYIALMGRRWAGKKEWAYGKKTEAEWADVRAYDATDIAQWLNQTPSVTSWFASEILGRPIDGVFSIERFLDDWSYRSQPTITREIILAGRDQQVQSFYGQLRGTNRVLTIRGDTHEECIIFLSAALLSAPEPERENWLARTLVITNQQVWQRILSMLRGMHSLPPLILVPSFESFDGSTAIARDHFLVLTSEPGQPIGKPDLLLSPIPRQQLAEKLLEIEPNKEKARGLAFDSGGKLTSLQRLLGYTHKVPNWAKQFEQIDVGLLLAGAWHPRKDKDKEILVSLCNTQDYPQIERRVNHLMNIADTPLRSQGYAIKWRSIKDAWQLLHPYITESDLVKFKFIAIDLISKHHPKYDLPRQDRMYAEIKGKFLSESGFLRTGLTETLAFLNLFKQAIEQRLGSYVVSNIISEVVRTVLDNDWKVWATFGQDLTILAEADPEQFIEAIEKALADPDKQFEQLFSQDPKDDHSFSNESAHSGLLWALETLAWSPEYYSRTTLILADLCSIDPGGQYANRAQATLISLFHPLVKQTSTANKDRLASLEVVCERHNERSFGWLQAIFGIYSRGGIVSPNHRPRFHDSWVLPEEFEEYSAQERLELYNTVSQLILDKLKKTPERLIEYLDNQDITLLEKQSLEILEDNLAIFTGLTFGSRYKLQTALRKRIDSWYFSRKQDSEFEEEISKAKELLHKLDSNDLAEKHAWLFADHYIVLPEPEGRDFDEREARVTELREAAIAEIGQTSSPVSVLISLAEYSKYPRLIGLITGRSTNGIAFQDEILEQLLPQAGVKQQLALGYIASRYNNDGISWLKNIVKNLVTQNDDQTAALVLTCVSNNLEIRTFVRQQSQSLENQYWVNVNGLIRDIVDEDDFKYIIDKLLKVGRWETAIRNAVWAITHNDGVGSSEDYLKILDYGTQATTDQWQLALKSTNNWDFAQIFKHLDNKTDITSEKLAQLEVLYIDLLDRSKRPPKHIVRHIEESPEFFAELIEWGFKPHHQSEDERESEPEPERIKRHRLAKITYKLRDTWNGYPGIEEADEEVRDEQIRGWCEKVLERTQKSDRKAVGEIMVGEVLARVPPPTDDQVWPGTVAREYIEKGYRDIASGIRTAKYNSRGVTSRALDAGGELERSLAKHYRQEAEKIKSKWVKTAVFLNQIAESYERQAKDHDARSERYIDP